MPLQFFKLSLKKTQFLTNQTKRWTPVQSNKKRDSSPIKQKDGLLSNQTKRWTPVQSTNIKRELYPLYFFNNFLKKF